MDNPNLKYMAVFFASSGAFPIGVAFLSWGLNSMLLPTRQLTDERRALIMMGLVNRRGGAFSEGCNRRIYSEHWHMRFNYCYVCFLIDFLYKIKLTGRHRWTYVPSDGPRYIQGHSINLGMPPIPLIVSVRANTF